MSPPANLQPLLRQAYDRARWQTILQDVLPSGALHLFQQPENVDAACEHVTAVVQTGRVSLGEESIALLEVRVADQVKLARNRVALRNFVARFVDEAATSAVIAVFHQPGQPEWRLTYASRRSVMDEDTLEITSVQTAPRRFTFLLGPAEPCRTAAGRLAEMRERAEKLTLADVEKAFSVERLNKDFFKRYKEHYEKFTAHLLSPALAAGTRRAFGNKTRGEDPVIHFYEHFLSAHNKQLKIQRGVFYTPQPVVSYIVRSVHELLQTEFGLVSIDDTRCEKNLPLAQTFSAGWN